MEGDLQQHTCIMRASQCIVVCRYISMYCSVQVLAEFVDTVNYISICNDNIHEKMFMVGHTCTTVYSYAFTEEGMEGKETEREG